jgi:hypothetical protein
VADTYVTGRRFADQYHVGRELAGFQQMLHPPATALFHDGVRNDDVAGRAVLQKLRSGVRLQRQRALDVHGAAAVQKTLSDVAAEWSVLPRRRVAYVDDIEMTAEHERR